MITRSAIKKGFVDECKVAKPVPHVTKKRARKPKPEIQTPIKVNFDAQNGETNLENFQLPVFNIHIHMPPPVTGNLNKADQFQPVIHLHLGEVISKFCSGATSENVEKNNNTSVGASQSKVNCNSEKKDNSKESKLSRPFKKNKTCKELNFKERSENLKIENTIEVAQLLSETQENEGFARKSFSKEKLPVRRSVRLADNKKLSQILKDFSKNKSVRNKIKRKTCGRNKKAQKHVVETEIENNSHCIGETLILKEPLLVLQDVMKVKKKNMINCFNSDTDDKQEDCFRPVDASTSDSSANVEIHSLNLLDEGTNEKKSQENEKNLKKDMLDENSNSALLKVRDVYSLVYFSDNETSSASDFTDKYTFLESVEMNFENEPEKDFNGSSLDNTIKDIKNNSDDNASLHPEKHEIREIRVVQENGFCHSISKEKDLSVNFEHSATETKSKDSSSDSELPVMANFEEVVDNDHFDSPKELDKEEINNLECENDNIVENVEENRLSFSEANSYKETNIETLNFHLDLIKKEMKKRDMIVKRESSRKKRKIESQAKITKEVAEKSPEAEKKLPKKQAVKRPALEKLRKTAEDYIPLHTTGPTKFAVAQLSKVKPCSGHRAKNFKNERFFSSNIKRYSDPKKVKVYLLKKKAAQKRVK